MPLFRPTISSMARYRMRQTPATRPFSFTSVRRAQGYGDPDEGGPQASNPQDQPASSDAKHNAEHPGPEPPSEGKGSGGGPTKGGKTPEDASAQSGGSRSKEAKETGSSPTGGEIKDGGKSDNSRSESKNCAEPKLASKMEDSKDKLHHDQKAEVDQHNKEFEKGHDRAGPEGGVDG